MQKQHKVECLEHKKLIERSETKKQPPAAGTGTGWGKTSQNVHISLSQAIVKFALHPPFNYA